MRNLGREVASNTIKRVPQENGIEPANENGDAVGRVVCRERLGGLLKYYYREAA